MYCCLPYINVYGVYILRKRVVGIDISVYILIKITLFLCLIVSQVQSRMSTLERHLMEGELTAEG